MDSIIGTVQLFAFPFAPRGWMKCEGQLLSVAQNQALFNLIGAQYGGDNRTTFALPDLKGKSPQAGVDYYICAEGIFPSRN